MVGEPHPHEGGRRREWRTDEAGRQHLEEEGGGGDEGQLEGEGEQRVSADEPDRQRVDDPGPGSGPEEVSGKGAPPAVEAGVGEQEPVVEDVLRSPERGRRGDERRDPD